MLPFINDIPNFGISSEPRQKDHGVQISMDCKWCCMDNIFIERLWRSVKYEKIFLEEFVTVPELLSGLKDYFKFYNFERPLQSLVVKTPAKIYWGREVAKKAALIIQ